MAHDKKRSDNIDFSVWKKMGPFLSKFKGSFAVVFAMMLFMSLVDILIPIFLQQAVDRFAVPRTTDGIGGFTLVYLLVIVAQGLSVVIMTRRAMAIEMHLGKDLKRATFLHLQRLDLSYYNQHSVGWILARVMSDTDRISSVVAWALTDLLWSAFYVVGVLITMLILNWKLALLVVAVVPLVAILTLVFQGKFLRTHREMRRVNSEITAAFNEVDEDTMARLRNSCAGEVARLNGVVAFEDAYKWQRGE